MAAPAKEKTQGHVDWPGWLQPLAEKYANQAWNLAMPNGQVKEYDPNLDQRVAGMDPNQQAAISRIIDLSGSQQNQDLTNAAGAELTKTLRGEYLDPDTNPYLRETYEDASRALTDEYQTSTSPELMSAALRAKAFGSTAHNEYADQARYDLGENLSGLATKIYGTNYSQERDRQFNAQSQIPQYLQSQFLPQQAALEAAGMRQAQTQAEMDSQTQNAIRREQYPFQTLDWLGQGLQTALGPAQSSVNLGYARQGGIGGAMHLK